MVCTEPVADIPTMGHDVPGVAESPIRQNSCETDGGGVILLFGMDTVDFPRILMIHSRRLCSVARCFGMRTLPNRHECCQTVGMCLYRHCRFSLIQYYL